MDKTYNMKLTKRFKKALNEISLIDKRLTAEVLKKIELLENNKLDQLDIDLIKRVNPKHKILEIRIFHPQNYRVFFVYVTQNENDILLIDGRKKKVDKFKSDYYFGLDTVIDNYIKENY